MKLSFVILFLSLLLLPVSLAAKSFFEASLSKLPSTTPTDRLTTFLRVLALPQATQPKVTLSESVAKHQGTSTTLVSRHFRTTTEKANLFEVLIKASPDHDALSASLPRLFPREYGSIDCLQAWQNSMIILYIMWLHSSDSAYLLAILSSSGYKLRQQLYYHWLRRVSHCVLRHHLRHSLDPGGTHEVPLGTLLIVLARLYPSANKTTLSHMADKSRSPPVLTRTVFSQATSITFGPQFSSDNSGDGPVEPESTYKSLWTNIPTYKQDDYISWSKKFCMVLPLDLEDLITGEEKADLEEDWNLDEFEWIEAVTRHKQRFKLRNKLLYQGIATSVIKAESDLGQSLIESVPSGDGLAAWAKLKEFHTNRSTQNKYTVVMDILSLKQSKGETALDFKVRLEKAFKKIDDLNIRLSDIMTVSYLNGLSRKFKDLVSSLSVKDGELRMEEVYQQIVAFESRHSIASEDVAHAHTAQEVTPDSIATLQTVLQGLFSNQYNKSNNGNSNQRKRPRSEKPQISSSDSSVRMSLEELNSKYPNGPAPWEKTKTCKKCKKKGHTMRTCRLKRNKAGETANIAVAGDMTQRLIQSLAAQTNPQESKFIKFCVDSGCTRHMVMSTVAAYMTDLTAYVAPIHTLGDTTYTSLTGILSGLRNCLVVPSASNNLLSVSQLCDSGKVVVFTNAGFSVHHAHDIQVPTHSIINGNRVGGLYEAFIPKPNNQGSMVAFTANTIPHKSHKHIPDMTLSTTSQALDSSLLSDIRPVNKFTMWHNRLGHPNKNVLCDMVINNTVQGMSFTQPESKSHQKSGFCVGCAYGKFASLPIRRTPRKQPKQSQSSPLLKSLSDTTADKNYKPGELVLVDLIFSPVQALLSGSTIALILTDVATRYNWVYFLKHKDDDTVCAKMQEWLNYMRLHTKMTAGYTTIRSDNGSEFISAKFKQLLADNNIRRERCPPYAHVYMAERANRTIQESARAMLYQQDVPHSFWAEAVAYSVYVNNRLSCSSNRKQTRYELFHGNKPDIKHLRTFGCTVYAKQYEEQLKKWDTRAFKGRFVGVDDTTPKTWKIFKPDSHRFLFSSQVKFDESDPAGKEGKSDFQIAAEQEGLEMLFSDPMTSITELADIDDDVSVDGPNLIIQAADIQGKDSSVNKRKRNKLVSKPIESGPPAEQVPLRRTQRPHKPRHNSYFSVNENLQHRCLAAVERNVPANYKQAVEGQDKEHWIQSIQREVDALISNKTFTIIEKPSNIRPIGFKWVFKIKENKDGTIERYKTRCTALGNLQRPGVDFDETFAPVVRYSTIRLLLAKAATSKLLLHHMDIDTAFLYGTLDKTEEVYMKVPDTVQIPSHLQGKEVVCKIHKGIYGLRQSPRLFNRNLDQTLSKIGFTKSKHDACLYIRKSGSEISYITVYVDDLVIASSSIGEMNVVKQQLKDYYRMKDLGQLNYILGMEVSIDDKHNIKLSQSKYISDVLKRFGHSNSNTVSTPLPPGIQLTPNNETDNIANTPTYPYREVVGSLMYLMVSSRPDIAYAVGYLARFLNAHNIQHHKAANHVLKYLKHTAEIGITYHSTQKFELIGYSDSDWASDVLTRRSTTGYLFMCAGGPVSWKSRLQPTVALSSSEAEYMALSQAAQEAIALSYLYSDINTCDVKQKDKNTILLYEDNQGAIAMANNPTHYAKTKHIHLRYHFVREQVEMQTITVQYIDTNLMLADALTKSLTRDTFELLRCKYMST